MAISLNKVQIIGTLGRDPESRSLGASGDRVLNLSVATSESWKDKGSGEWKEKTEWNKVAIFNEHMITRAEKARKGDMVYLEGELQTRKWQKDGVDMYTTEVVLKKFKGDFKILKSSGGSSGGGYGDGGYDDGYSTGGGSRGPSYEPAEPTRTSRGGYDLNDDIPF